MPPPVLTPSACAGGAATCRPWTYSLPHSDALPPQGGAGLPRFIGGSTGCSPGWLCSGKAHIYVWSGWERIVLMLLFLIEWHWTYLFASPRCSPASWIRFYSCVPCRPVTWALLTWLATWSTRCTSWRPRSLCLSSPTRGSRCSSSRSAWILIIISKLVVNQTITLLVIYTHLIKVIQGHESNINTTHL